VWNIEEPVSGSSDEPSRRLAWDGGDIISTRSAGAIPVAPPNAQGTLRIASDHHREVEVGQTETGSGPAEIVTAADEADHPWLREVLGTGGTRRIAVIAENEGHGILRVDLKPPWDPEAQPMATVSVTIRVVAQHGLNGFASRQPVAHAARLAA
jgi:hypothetical protein